ncbi:hypothetical protein DPMN_065074 [Dreissena polymorpha]|uniref:Uncharacterized protein n=1 Tax=Dreissena polymorpha TaxID=45954 RepID=A0A9D4CEB9_DREPO|nr:hypothetical protein DPMN_065074 [Dreissena polymorpha]
MAALCQTSGMRSIGPRSGSSIWSSPTEQGQPQLYENYRITNPFSQFSKVMLRIIINHLKERPRNFWRKSRSEHSGTIL